MFYIDNMSNHRLGVIAQEEDFLARAAIQYDEIYVEGKDGSDFIEKNFVNVVGTMTLSILKDKNIDKILKYFTGKRELTFNDRKTKIYFFDAIPITRYGSIKSMTVSYIRSPFWYLKNDSKIKAIESINNAGNIYSKPMIELIGSGTVEVTVNQIHFEYIFDDDGKVYIDCEEKSEFYDGKSKSRNMKIGFEYPTLKPGINKINIIGNAVMYFTRKDRYL